MFTSGITAKRLARVWRGTVILVEACLNWNTCDFLRRIKWEINGVRSQESGRRSTFNKTSSPLLYRVARYILIHFVSLLLITRLAKRMRRRTGRGWLRGTS